MLCGSACPGALIAALTGSYIRARSCAMQEVLWLPLLRSATPHPLRSAADAKIGLETDIEYPAIRPAPRLERPASELPAFPAFSPTSSPGARNLQLG